MYDWEEVAWAHDALWSAISGRLNAAGVAAPPTVDRSRSTESVWRDPNLLLSQTCGYPFSTRLRAMVKLVAVPIYDVAGCDGPHYSSVIVSRHDDEAKQIGGFKGRRVAFNSRDSFSGYFVLRAAMVEAGIDPAKMEWIETGSHRASIRAVAGEKADIAAIDAVCWALALKHEPQSVAALKVVSATPLRPGLPLITAVERTDHEVSAIREVLIETFKDPETQAAREALHLVGIGTLDEWDYLPIAALAHRSG